MVPYFVRQAEKFHVFFEKNYDVSQNESLKYYLCRNKSHTDGKYKI